MPKIAKLTGINGNAFSVMGVVNRYLKQENPELSKEYMANVMRKGSYDELLAYSLEMLEKAGFEVE